MPLPLHYADCDGFESDIFPIKYVTKYVKILAILFQTVPDILAMTLFLNQVS